jgi:hypothetical protein
MSHLKKTVRKNDHDKLYINRIYFCKPLMLIKAFNFFSVQCLNIAYHKAAENTFNRKGSCLLSSNSKKALFSTIFLRKRNSTHFANIHVKANFNAKNVSMTFI